MNIIICEECEEENEFGLKYCKNCGYELYYCDSNDPIEDEEENEEDYSFNVDLSIEEAVEKIKSAYIGATFSIDRKKTIKFSDEKKCVILVGQKYFQRVENFVAVTIIINNIGEYTNIEVISTGGSLGFWGDLGAESDFEKQIEKIFKDYIIINF